MEVKDTPTLLHHRIIAHHFTPTCAYTCLGGQRDLVSTLAKAITGQVTMLIGVIMPSLSDPPNRAPGPLVQATRSPSRQNPASKISTKTFRRPGCGLMVKSVFGGGMMMAGISRFLQKQKIIRMVWFLHPH